VCGQTTVEFAFICLPFFIILFAIIDFAQIYFYENSVQNAMREAARFATAGSVIQATVGGVPQ
jgi:Flp pilus assembly protein TadG